MRIVGFGTYDSGVHPRIRVVLQGLAAADDVREVNVPLAVPTAARVEYLRCPWLLPRPAVLVLRCWASLVRLWVADLRRHGRPDAVVVGYAGHLDVLLARILYRRSTVVLDQLVFAADTARDRGLRSAVLLRALGALDRLACRCADLVMVDTVEQVGLLGADEGKAVVVPVGAAWAWYEAAEAGRPRLVSTSAPSACERLPRSSAVPAPPPPPLKVLFFGTYVPLQGAPVVAAALAELAGADGAVSVTLVGCGQDRGAAQRLAGSTPYLEWLDWVSPDRLPALAAAHDVCLGIFGTSPKALRVVPNKVYQGAAAGCAVITSDTPPQRRALGDAPAYVPPGDAAALARLLRMLAGDRERVARLRRDASAVARRYTPDRVVEPLRAALSDARDQDQRQA